MGQGETKQSFSAIKIGSFPMFQSSVRKYNVKDSIYNSILSDRKILWNCTEECNRRPEQRYKPCSWKGRQRC